MKKLLPAFCISLFLLAACNQDKKETVSVKTERNFAFNQKIAHAFSDQKSKDIFEVNLSGNKPADMILAFSITTAEGKSIYDIKIKATDLLGSTDPNIDLREEPAQIEFIKNVAKEFLSEENFLVPAVSPNQVPDDYTPDKAFYEELKKSGLNGFTYRLGKENNFYIAWSQQDKKVKVYYNCC